MGLDIAKLRKKMRNIDEHSNGGSNVTWYNLHDGRNVVRILPAKDGGNGFYKEARIHYSLNMIGMEKKQMNCRFTDPDAKRCPLCETQKMLAESDKSSENKIAKRIKARSRFFLNVCLNSVNDRDDQNWNDVMVMNCPQTVFRDILNVITDEDFLDEDGNSFVLDPEEGYDFIIKRSGEKPHVDYTVTVRPKSSKIHIKNWKEKLNNLSDMCKVMSEKDMYKAIQGEDSEDDEEDEDEVIRHKKAQHHKKPEYDDEEDYEEEEEEKPRHSHRPHNTHHHKPIDDDEEDDYDDEDEEDIDTDDEDESEDLAKEIKEHANRISKGHTRSHKKHRETDDEEDDEEDDEDSDPF